MRLAPKKKTGWLEDEERERPVTRLPGVLVLAGRVHPQVIAGHALGETGADGIGFVFVNDEGEDG
jgi:hypothetical protein